MYKTISVIVAWWKKRSFSTYSNEFIFLSICVYLFENCPSQFLSCWESAEPAFCSQELSKSALQKQKPDSKLFGGKIQVCCMLRPYKQAFLPPGTFI